MKNWLSQNKYNKWKLVVYFAIAINYTALITLSLLNMTGIEIPKSSIFHVAMTPIYSIGGWIQPFIKSKNHNMKGDTKCMKKVEEKS